MTFGFPAYHTETYAPSGDGADIRASVKSTLQAVSWSIRNEFPDRIEASISFNFRSWGENVVVTFLPNGTVSVTSSCVLPTQCFDWGKNKANVETFMAELKKHA